MKKHDTEITIFRSEDSLSQQIRKGQLTDVDCPSRDVLKHITSLWGVLALLNLKGRTLRFSELRRSIPVVSERMLSQTLRTLEADGFINRVSYDVIPPHVEYSLTALGDDVSSELIHLVDWIEMNIHRVMQYKRDAGLIE